MGASVSGDRGDRGDRGSSQDIPKRAARCTRVAGGRSAQAFPWHPGGITPARRGARENARALDRRAARARARR
jgi:hypothetical protein